MKALITRSITGAVYVALIISSLIFHPLFFLFLLALINTQSLIEYRRMDAILSAKSIVWVMLNGILFVAAVLLHYFDSPLSIAPLILYILLVLIQALYLKSDHAADNISRVFFASLYISLPLYILAIMHLNTLGQGIPFILLVFILIWANDSFAYLFGISLGRHRLFERISPKKSWEGFIGGVLMTMLLAYLLAKYYPELSHIAWIGLGLLIALGSVFGDLVESLLKRSAGVKDSGSLLPGHGGVLDRIDSLLFVGPIVYIYLLIYNLV